MIIEQKNKAKALQEAYEEAKNKADLLNKALQYFVSTIREVGIVKHKIHGDCDVLSVDEKYIRLRVKKSGEEKKLGLAIAIANGIIKLDTPEFDAKREEYLGILKQADSIPNHLEYASRALEPYEEYLN